MSQKSIQRKESDHFVLNDPSFTMNEAFELTGGFGRFQYLMLILLAIVRNYGMYQTQGFAMMIMQQDYNCWWDLDKDSEVPKINMN